MNDYPKSIDDYPPEWIDLLDLLDPNEMFDVDCKAPVEKLKGTNFDYFVQTIKQLTNIPKIIPAPELPLEDWAFQGVKKKKRHEIQKIVPVLKKLHNDKHFSYVVDIGGGVGHLSRVLSHYHAIPSISIDQNPNFQEIGKGRLSKFRKIEGAKDVTFINMTFGKDENEYEDKTKAKLKTVFNKEAMGLGLHTCGALANILIQKTIDHESMGLLSFGCCYHTLKPNIDFPLSNFYKEKNLPILNLYGFTLATRAHGEMSFDTFKTKERVKQYRYALHLFLIRNYGTKDFVEVGECQLATYWKPFHNYISEKLRFLNIEHSFTDDDFDNFFEAEDIQRELRVMFLCNIIRWQLGRVLEVYLQIDRCLYLEENGYLVALEQYFEESLSPRNLGILALHK